MNEVYWITDFLISHPFSGSPGEFEEQVSSRHIRPAWIDEIHYFAPEETLQTPPQKFLKFFTWEDKLVFNHYHLHAAAWSILAGNNHLIAIFQHADSAIDGLLLASPEAVGRYNLLPRVQLSGFYSAFTCQTAAPWSNILQEASCKTRPEDLLLQSGFTEAQALSNSPTVLISGNKTNLIQSFNCLVQALEKQACERGFFVSLNGDNPVLITRLERL